MTLARTSPHIGSNPPRETNQSNGETPARFETDGEITGETRPTTSTRRSLHLLERFNNNSTFRLINELILLFLHSQHGTAICYRELKRVESLPLQRAKTNKQTNKQTNQPTNQSPARDVTPNVFLKSAQISRAPVYVCLRVCVCVFVCVCV